MPKNAKAIAGILLIFILGVITGAVVTHLVDQRNFATVMHGGPRAREEHIVQQLNKELLLDSGQLEQVRGILRETHAAIREIRGQIRPRIEAILDKVSAKY